ncbi:NAD(P)H-hydrate dehydratase [Phaeovulum sp. W22_SRMD_FR3]|uniref:NAD(P)H-hydrate dehydratase n=1 Tax=Phaeovulum sp. W22_SRMD_FR3 TaxID=3240274 RepID=UPI003F9C86EE
MTEILTATQMRAAEAAAMASGALSGAALMRRAAAEVVAAMRSEWPERCMAGQAAVVLCGPGNNGGDGAEIARLLAALGMAVTLVSLPGTPGPAAQEMRAGFTGPVIAPEELSWELLAARPLVVDALFGTGLSRPLAGGVWGLLGMAQESGCPLVAVDILSGICADSGRVLAEGEYIDHPADLTVTFHAAKPGHFLDQGGFFTAKLVVADIGLGDAGAAISAAEQIELITGPVRSLAKIGRHKYAHGHAVVLSGGQGRGGAARLAARAALRIGAGLVTLICPPTAVTENAARLEAIMLRSVADAYALQGFLQDKRINAVCLGPGLEDPRARATVPQVLALARPTVLDADALTAFATDPKVLFDILHADCVLTPHEGEFARLFPDLAGQLSAPAQSGPAYSRLDAVRAAAARAGCVVLLKGADTVIAAPGGQAAISAATGAAAAPWLATAGAGDVLAGLITGLIARGHRPFDAVCSAAWLHAEAARAFGPGLIAEDLPEALPGVLRHLGA